MPVSTAASHLQPIRTVWPWVCLRYATCARRADYIFDLTVFDLFPQRQVKTFGFRQTVCIALPRVTPTPFQAQRSPSGNPAAT